MTTHPGRTQYPCMAARKVTPTRKRRLEPAFPPAELVDRLMSRYVSWRERAAAVADAYRQWSDAPADERASRFAAYLGALDLEESSAHSYALLVADVERSLHHDRGQFA
jgi:hypothetical protein